MSYTTGSADSLPDLLAKIRVIAEAAGWVTQAATSTAWTVTSADGNASYVLAYIAADTPDTQQFWSVSSRGPCLALSNCKSIDLGAPLWNQPGQDFKSGKETRTSCLYFGVSGPYAKYYAFATAQYVHVVVEVITGSFGHLLMGSLDKDGTVYDGGSYNGCTTMYRPMNVDVAENDTSNGNGIGSPFSQFPFCERYPYAAASRVRVENVDNIVSPSCDNFYHISGDATREGTAIGPWLSGWNGYLSAHPDAGIIAASASELGGNTMMVPAAIYHWGAQLRTRYLGVIPDHAICNMQFLAPGDIVTYGTDEWMVFPAWRKGTSPTNSTLNAGVAYRLRR